MTKRGSPTCTLLWKVCSLSLSLSHQSPLDHLREWWAFLCCHLNSFGPTYFSPLFAESFLDCSASHQCLQIYHSLLPLPLLPLLLLLLLRLLPKRFKINKCIGIISHPAIQSIQNISTIREKQQYNPLKREREIDKEKNRELFHPTIRQCHMKKFS